MHRQASTSRVADLPQTSQPTSVFSPRKRMEEAADLPLYHRNSSVNKREISRTRLAAKSVHLIPAVVLLCIFILWWFSYEANVDAYITSKLKVSCLNTKERLNLERSNGRIAASRLLKTQKTMFSNLTYPPYPSISEIQMTGNVSIAR